MSDSVSVGVTHEIKIDGLSSWIRADVVLERAPSDTIADTWDRCSKVLTSKIIAEVEKQAAVVVEANKTH